MDESVQRRVAANQAAFRRVNEGIERGRWPGEESELVGFRCECARLGCNLLVELSSIEYERIREHPRRFVVAPGHELPDVETVIASEPGYVVVEKRDEAGAAAEATDPRG